MVPDVTSGLPEGSHKRVVVRCDFGVSEKCKKSWEAEWRTVLRFRKGNNGQDICMYCSRRLKYSGRKNPNTRYRDIMDNMFSTVDTEEKAYLLGWVASDGHVSKGGFAISIHHKDEAVLHLLKRVVSADLLIAKSNGPFNPMVALRVSSKQISQDICSLLEISPGRKSDTVKFPKLSSEALSWAFLRGFFDGDGSVADVSVSAKKEKWPHPRATIATSSIEMRNAIKAFAKIPCSENGINLEWGGANAVDFMSKLYDDAKVYLPRKRDLYLDWCQWVPALSGAYSRDPGLRWVKTTPDAVAPHKTRASDSGYDLTIIAMKKKVGSVEFYDTGVKVQPPHGWYFDLVPRSSITKTGYMLANSIGVIDRTYTGNVLVPLIKVDPEAPALELPTRLVQIIPRPIVHFGVEQVLSLDDTERGSGGFGSTGTK